jgi:small-conductance mechanosensitive channel
LAQDAAPAPTTVPAPATVPAATTAPAEPEPTIDFVEYAESTSSAVRNIEADLNTNETTRLIEDALPSLNTEITARSSETTKLLSPSPSLETLRTLERDWAEFRRQMAETSRQLSTRAGDLRRIGGQLTEMQDRSRQVIEVAQRVEAEPELLRRVESLGADIDRLRRRLDTRLDHVQQLQGRVTVLDVRASDTLTAVRDARESAVTRLLDRDSPPLWRSLQGQRAQQNLAEDGRNTFENQWFSTRAYVLRRLDRIVLHLVLIILIASSVVWVRKRYVGKLGDDPAVQRSLAIFAMPISTALVTTLPLIPWLYPQGPRLFLAMLFGALLIPAIVVLRQLVMRPLLPLLYAMVGFYIVDLAVSVTASLATLSRTIFFCEMVGGMIFLALFIRRAPRSKGFPQIDRTLRWRIVNRAVRIALPVMLISALANLMGYVSLSNLLGRAVLSSAYIAIILDAALRVTDALLLAIMQMRPVAAIRMVRRHGPVLRQRIVGLLSIGAAIWWFLLTLDALALREAFVRRVSAILSAEWGVGAVQLTLGGILAFIAAVAAAFVLSRLARFLLEEDVYPRVQLARGVPNAISTLLHYVILFLGFLIAVAALGYDMTKFTILAGAFGVGLGFGMQNIVNNFVSGLILLFERPIQVGDVIELDPATVGIVERIGIRASVIRLQTSAEVIVPNGLLIAGRVTNWTLSNRQRGFNIDVTIPAGVEPEKVLSVLKETARQHPRVSSLPAPQASVEMAGGGALKVVLSVWTDRYDEWLETRSELVMALHAALLEAGIQRA